jgi:hypothetical protein
LVRGKDKINLRHDPPRTSCSRSIGRTARSIAWPFLPPW